MTEDFLVETTDESGALTVQPPEPAADSPAESPYSESPSGEGSDALHAAGESADVVDAPSVEAPVVRNDDGTFKTKAKRGTAQYRIDQKSWEAAEARRQAADERRQREALASELAALRQQKPAAAPQAQPPTGLDLGKFNTYEEYVRAEAEDAAKRLIGEERAAYQRQREMDRVLAVRQTYAQRQEAFAAKTPDFWEVVHNSRDLPLSPVMEHAILTSDQGPAIIYFLSTHPEAVDQLIRETATTPVDAAPLMRRLFEAQLGPTASSIPARSAAQGRSYVPAPIRPVGSGTSVAAPFNDDSDDLDAHVREYNRREKKPLPREFLSR